MISSWGVFGQEPTQDLTSEHQAIKLDFHRINYMMPYYHLQKRVYDLPETEEMKFQFSLKLEFLTINKGAFAVAYTQAAWWQVTDSDNSRPFRENNYNPEVFYRFGGNGVYFDLGLDHESNGEDDPESRSQNRFYGQFMVEHPKFRFRLKGWTFFAHEVYGDDQVERTRHFEDYYGFAETEVTILFGEVLVTSIGRLNWDTGYGYQEHRLMLYLANGFFIGGVYTKGYGESLRAYNISNETYGFGIFLNP